MSELFEKRFKSFNSKWTPINDLSGTDMSMETLVKKQQRRTYRILQLMLVVISAMAIAVSLVADMTDEVPKLLLFIISSVSIVLSICGADQVSFFIAQAGTFFYPTSLFIQRYFCNLELPWIPINTFCGKQFLFVFTQWMILSILLLALFSSSQRKVMFLFFIESIYLFFVFNLEQFISQMMALSIFASVITYFVKTQKSNWKNFVHTHASIRTDERDEEAMLIKNGILSYIGDQIRAPLNATTPMIQMLEESHLDPNQKEMVKSLKKALNTFKALIIDVADYTKIDDNSIVLYENSFDLLNCIETICDDMWEFSKDKKIDICSSVSKDIDVVVTGDEKRIYQILTNLIRFCINQIYDGSVCIVLTFFEIEDRKQYIFFEISDNGSGLDEIKLNEVFKPFKLTEGELFSNEMSGLGMAISNHLVKFMSNKNIGVENDPNGGVTFSFMLSFKKSKVIDNLRDSPLIVPDQETRIYLAMYHAKCAKITARRLEDWTSKIYKIVDVNIFEKIFLESQDCIFIIDILYAINQQWVVPAEDEYGAHVRILWILNDISDIDKYDIIIRKGIDEKILKPIKEKELRTKLYALSQFSSSIIDIDDYKKETLVIIDENKEKINITGKILIVESDLIKQNVIKTTLSTKNIEFHLIDKGKAALIHLSVIDDDYTLILIGSELGDIDAYTFAQSLKERGVLTNIICMVENKTDEIIRRCEVNGIDAVMQEPFKWKTFYPCAKKMIM